LRGAPARSARRQPDALHAAGRRGGGVADIPAAAGLAAAGPRLRARLLGPRGVGGTGRRPRTLARTVDRRMSEPATGAVPAAQSAAAPSPFPPIADYALLST